MVARVVKEEDIMVARVAKEDTTVEEATEATPFTTVEAVPPRSTPPIRTGVTMAVPVVAEVLVVTETRTAMAVLDTGRRTAVAVAVEEVIMVTERLTAVAAVLEGFTTLFKSFFLHVCIWSTNKSKTQKQQ